jgi:hypothetical protein
MILFITACNGQDTTSSKNKKEAISKNEQNKPKGTWKVQKELDENGNIIRYDSIYSWSSTGNPEDLMSINIDSLMRSHQSFIHKRFSALENQDFPYLFKEDSLFSKKFFEEDLLLKHFRKDFPEMEEMNKKMEKIQKELLNEFFPNQNFDVKKKNKQYKN